MVRERSSPQQYNRDFTKQMPVTTMGGYKIVRLGKEDMEKVQTFLRKSFFKDEPLNVAVNLLKEAGSCRDVGEYACSCIDEGLSLAAINPEGEIVGLSLNSIMRREEQFKKKSDDDENQNMVQNGNGTQHEADNVFKDRILLILNALTENSDVFGKYPNIQSLMDVRVLSVDETYRGQGIAKTLVEKTKELAQELDIPLVKIDCTSHYSAKAAERLGFHCIYTLPYNEFLGKNGKPVVVPQLPHKEAKTYVLELK